MSIKTVRHLINDALHNPRTLAARTTNGILSFLIIFSIAVIPLHFFTSLEWIHEELFIFDRITVTIFTFEYLLRIWSAKRPIAYVTSWWGLVDLVAILPFYLEKMGIFQVAEVFLMLRVLRILKFARGYEMEEIALSNKEIEKHGMFEILPGEKVEQIVHKHAIVFLLGLILPLFFTSAGLAIFIFFQEATFAVAIATLLFFFAGIFFFKAWLDYNYDVIYITNFRVIFQERELFGSIKNDISYEAITNVVPNNTGIFRWIFGIGDIHIETAAMAGTLFFENSPNPHKIVRHISANRQKILAVKHKQEQEGLKIMEQFESEEAK